MSDARPDFTRRLLADAGLGAGMCVLDIGCGAGDVTFLAAALVGEAGSVTGIDRDADALARARARPVPPGLPVPTFVDGDLEALPETLGPFDAVVGRRVLMYQPDPARTVRALAKRLRPGGIVAFQEHDLTMGPASLVPFPLHERAQGWLRGMVEREGADVSIGFRLHGILARAGLQVEAVRSEAIVQTPNEAYGLGDIVRTCLPRIVGQGIATAEDVGIATLQDRLDAERAEIDAIFIGGMMFGAWARKPAMG